MKTLIGLVAGSLLASSLALAATPAHPAGATTAATHAAKPSHKECTKHAEAKNLHSGAREEFVKKCMEGKAE
jgi:hypothetical protein